MREARRLSRRRAARSAPCSSRCWVGPSPRSSREGCNRTSYTASGACRRCRRCRRCCPRARRCHRHRPPSLLSGALALVGLRHRRCCRSRPSFHRPPRRRRLLPSCPPRRLPRPSPPPPRHRRPRRRDPCRRRPLPPPPLPRRPPPSRSACLRSSSSLRSTRCSSSPCYASSCYRRAAVGDAAGGGGGTPALPPSRCRGFGRSVTKRRKWKWSLRRRASGGRRGQGRRPPATATP